jgi:anti-sigma-K factor RskA
MKYQNPELREQLAAEYVLGTMPTLVRRRFERLLGDDAELRRTVDDWHERFAPIDSAEAMEEPPARVWRAIERRLAFAPTPGPEPRGWFGSLAFWRGATLVATALATSAIFYIARQEPPARTTVVAILSDDKGEPGWVALSGAKLNEIEVAPIGKIAGDAAHAFELWAIAGGTPSRLGLLVTDPAHPLTVQASVVPQSAVLAVSIEPPGGSPTGLPTGPVRYKGSVLPRQP